MSVKAVFEKFPICAVGQFTYPVPCLHLSSSSLITPCAQYFIDQSNSSHTGVLALSLLGAAEGERLIVSNFWAQTQTQTAF